MNGILLALALATSMVASAQTKPVKLEKKPATPAPASATAKPAPVAAIIANKDSKTYHRADCKAAAKIKEANKVAFASAAEAAKAGYKPCKVCKP